MSRETLIASPKMRIAQSFKYFPYKGIERFYDVGGLLNNPKVFRLVIDEMCRIIKYEFPGTTKFGLIDARGFLFAPIAIHFDLPIVMIRKPGKMPNTFTSQPYSIEYGKREGLSVQRHAVEPGDRILLLDDLLATGGTMASAIVCVEKIGATVEGCLTLIELDAFAKERESLFREDTRRASLFSDESELIALGAEAGKIPEDYIDDGIEK